MNKNSQNRRIVSGFLWVSLFVFLGKVVGAAKEMTIAWKYGVSSTVDAYVFIFNLLNWPVSVWMSIITIVLVPLYLKLTQTNAEEAKNFRSEIFGCTILISVVLGGLTIILFPELIAQNWFGLTESIQSEAAQMARPMALLLPLGLISALLAVISMASGTHRNTLFEAIPALVILLTLIVPTGSMGFPLVVGSVLGVLIQILILWWSLGKLNQKSLPSFKFKSPAWRDFLAGIGIMSLGQVLSSLTAIVDQVLAVGLSAGSLSTLSYANRILALILGMGATAVSRATLPVFSSSRASQLDDVNTVAIRWASIMFFGGLVILVVGFFISPYAVKLLFERGAFTSENTAEVTGLLRWSLTQIPFYFAGLVFVSALGSGQYYLFISLSGAANLALKFFVAIPLVKEYKLIGLVVSNSAMYAMSMLILYVALRFIGYKEQSKNRSI